MMASYNLPMDYFNNASLKDHAVVRHICLRLTHRCMDIFKHNSMQSKDYSPVEYVRILQVIMKLTPGHLPVHEITPTYHTLAEILFEIGDNQCESLSPLGCFRRDFYQIFPRSVDMWA
jgi:hypothetical protein